MFKAIDLCACGHRYDEHTRPGGYKGQLRCKHVVGRIRGEPYAFCRCDYFEPEYSLDRTQRMAALLAFVANVDRDADLTEFERQRTKALADAQTEEPRNITLDWRAFAGQCLAWLDAAVVDLDTPPTQEIPMPINPFDPHASDADDDFDPMASPPAKPPPAPVVGLPAPASTVGVTVPLRPVGAIDAPPVAGLMESSVKHLADGATVQEVREVLAGALNAFRQITTQNNMTFARNIARTAATRIEQLLAMPSANIPPEPPPAKLR